MLCCNKWNHGWNVGYRCLRLVVLLVLMFLQMNTILLIPALHLHPAAFSFEWEAESLHHLSERVFYYRGCLWVLSAAAACWGYLFINSVRTCIYWLSCGVWRNHTGNGCSAMESSQTGWCLSSQSESAVWCGFHCKHFHFQLCVLFKQHGLIFLYSHHTLPLQVISE